MVIFQYEIWMLFHRGLKGFNVNLYFILVLMFAVRWLGVLFFFHYCGFLCIISVTYYVSSLSTIVFFADLFWGDLVVHITDLSLLLSQLEFLPVLQLDLMSEDTCISLLLLG